MDDIAEEVMEITVNTASNLVNGCITITVPIEKEYVEKWVKKRKRELKLRDEREKWKHSQ